MAGHVRCWAGGDRCPGCDHYHGMADRPAIYAVLAFIASLAVIGAALLSVLAAFLAIPISGKALAWAFFGGLVAWGLFSWIDARKGPHGP